MLHFVLICLGTEAAFLMVGATEREARSMHPFAAGLD